ncbi:MAG: LysR family transcriptional regulator [Oligoflexia bacterium]|nr:LysR family transcriptional regulator [Oligoflexia bacterium]
MIRYEEIKKVMIAKTILENGSIQKAAKVLKVTPSAISQSLASLEKKIGAPLFIRQKGKVTATEKCIELLEKAKPAFHALDSLFAKEKNKLTLASLEIGTYESLAHTLLPKFIHRIKEEHPKVKVSISVSRTAEIIKKLRSGELCTAIIVESDSISGLNCIKIAEEELGFYVSSDLKDKIYDHDFLSNLGFGFLALTTDGLPIYMKKFLAQLGTKPKVTMTSDSFEVLRLAAVNKIAIAVLPKKVAEKNKGDLIELTTYQDKPLKYKGTHAIYLASLDRCDQEEAMYLAKLAKDSFL